MHVGRVRNVFRTGPPSHRVLMSAPVSAMLRKLKRTPSDVPPYSHRVSTSRIIRGSYRRRFSFIFTLLSYPCALPKDSIPLYHPHVSIL